jgi:hypothetical protein
MFDIEQMFEKSAEKRFASSVTEFYLLTMKSEGLLGLLSRTHEEDHDYQMWLAYNDHDDATGGWVPKCEARSIVYRILANLLSSMSFTVNSMEYTLDLRDIRVSFVGRYLNDTIYIEGRDRDLDLSKFEPCVEIIRSSKITSDAGVITDLSMDVNPSK